MADQEKGGGESEKGALSPFLQTSNDYIYVSNNPTNCIDILGLKKYCKYLWTLKFEKIFEEIINEWSEYGPWSEGDLRGMWCFYVRAVTYLEKYNAIWKTLKWYLCYENGKIFYEHRPGPLLYESRERIVDVYTQTDVQEPWENPDTNTLYCPPHGFFE